MYITTLKMRTFRNYTGITLKPPRGITVFVGENGAGKTNLLEAVHLCCLGRSHRTSQDRELIADGQESCAVQMTVARRDGDHDIGVRLYRESGRRKVLYVNGKTLSRTADLMGHSAAVIFSPEDLRLVWDGPDGRRRFLDMLLSQVHKGYFTALQQYTSALRHRNALLKQGDMRALPAWDETLARHASPIVKMRRAAAEHLNSRGREHYTHISGRDTEVFGAAYKSALKDAQDIPEAMLRGLKDLRDEEMRRQVTLFGPHRDDLDLTLSGKDARGFCSQGQARTIALSLKLGAFDLIEDALRESPILLLDDVLSELDPFRRRRLLERVGGVQTLITCTDRSDLTDARPDAVLTVSHGAIS